MTIDPDCFDESVLKFMGSAPVFEFGQRERYYYFHSISPKLSNLQNAFNSYRNTFSQLQSRIDHIEEAMLSIPEFSTSLKNCKFNQIMDNFRDSIKQYVETFNSKVISPIETFINNFDEMECLHQVYNEKKSLYEDALDKYMTDGNPPTKQLNNKIQAVVDTHKYASVTFVNFYNKMEEISTKIKNIPPALLIGFADSFMNQYDIINNIANENSNIFDKEERHNICDMFDKTVTQRNEAFESLSKAVNSAIPHYWKRVNIPFTGTSRMAIQGILYKKGKTFSQWKKRFVVVSGGNLCYAANVDEYMKKQNTINLLLCSVKVEKDQARPNCFSITTREGQTVYQTMSMYDAKLWVAVIEANIIMSMNGGVSKNTEQHTCSDCGARDASWITLNWGQYICSRCSGVHRSLGPSHSRVRSPTLDTIPKYMLETFKKINELADSNQLLEKNVGERKIEPAVTSEEREHFIQDKYVSLIYAKQTKMDIMKEIENKDFYAVYQCICSGNHRTYSGFLPLHEAAIVGDPYILCLIAMHCDIIDITDNSGWTPLTYAVFYGNKEAVEVLKEFGSNPDASKTVPIWKAAKSSENPEMSQMFPPENDQEFAKIIPPYGPLSLKQLSRKKFVTELDPTEIGELQNMANEKRGRGGKRASDQQLITYVAGQEKCLSKKDKLKIISGKKNESDGHQKKRQHVEVIINGPFEPKARMLRNKQATLPASDAKPIV